MKKLFALLAIATLVAFAAPAFAANPFADVPMNHWAYDAVAQLASTGCLVGYPDGSYKGPQPATRYEVAAIVARCLALHCERSPRCEAATVSRSAARSATRAATRASSGAAASAPGAIPGQTRAGLVTLRSSGPPASPASLMPLHAL